ncbi:BPSS1780 family membrane protein [Xenophilus aerolatus]|nr:BPSS1780 family membrane protein [Xenophilus aerolatus]
MKLLLVAPRTGAQWVREGLQAFRRAPMAFFSLFMLFMSAIALLSRVPVIGGALAVALAPASTLALMAAAEQASRLPPGRIAPDGRPVTAVLFASALGAVRSRVRPLVALGALYGVAVTLAGLLASAIAGDPMAGAFDAQGAPRPEVIQSAGFQFAMLLRMALYLPVALAFWHAPALVHWHAVPPVKSLFFSLVTCVRNFGAMAVYGLVWFAVVLAGSIVLSLAASVAMAAAGSVGVAVLVGGSFVLTAMFLTSTWFSFRDCFQAD